MTSSNHVNVQGSVRIHRLIEDESVNEASEALLEIIMDNIHKGAVPTRQTLVARLLRLGLIDELVQLFLRTTNRDSKDVIYTVEHLHRLIMSHFNGALDLVNPKLEKSTLDLMLVTLQDELDKDLTMNLVCVVFLATNIYLLKLDASEAPRLKSLLPDLELLFAYLAKLLRELPLRASDTLVRSTNGLIIAVKDRLDTLVDSITIRESFKAIVETVAEQCLIESRYKGAAILYSQIEDNVNAVKSLMRLGDVDTVVDYALLVRDVTVDRITINYMRHLKVDPKRIEEFQIRTKG